MDTRRFSWEAPHFTWYVLGLTRVHLGQNILLSRTLHIGYERT